MKVETARGGDQSRLARWLTALGLFTLALGVRALPWRDVLTDERVYFTGNDAYYHMRRIVYSVANFPQALEYDAYLNFPVGAKPIWSPLLDWLIAAMALPFMRDLGSGGLEDLERFAVWVPPVLGACTVVMTWALARRYFDASVGALAGLLLAVLSGHFWYSQVGFVDHHAAVAPLGLTLLAGGMALLAAEARGAATWGAATATGAAAGLLLLVWPGGLLHLALVQLGLGVAWLTLADGARAAAFAWRLALLHGVAFAIVAPLSLGNTWPQWGSFSPVVLSDFQPWYLGAGALLAASCAVVFGRLGHDATRWRRVGIATSLGGLLLGASAVVVPDLAPGAGDAWSWLAKRDAFQVHVAESQPLLIDGGRLDFQAAARRLTFFFFALPLALPGLAFAVRRRPDRAALWLLLGWTAAFLGLTLLQRRFFNSLSAGLTIAFAASVVLGFRALPRAVLGRAALRRLALAAAAVVMVLLVLPTTVPYLRPLSNELALARGEKQVVTPSFVAMRSGVEAAAFLRADTPRTSGWTQPRRRPEYGVLAPWHLGHVIKYVGRRPTVVDNFGDDVGADGWAWSGHYYESSELEILDALGARRVRYVVAQRGHLFLDEPPGLGTLHHSLYHLDGSRFLPEPNTALPEVPALTRHRLVYETQPVFRDEPEATSLYKVYEVVPGVSVEGEAPPGTPITFELVLRTNRKRRIEWEAGTRAAADGRYRMHLPYATLGAPPGVRPHPFYRVSCPGEERPLRVGEAQIQQGQELSGPPMCTGNGGGGFGTPSS